MKLEILDELKNLIPPLKDEEREQLHAELDSHGGAHDPLIVWRGKNILVDGHNRYEYCVANNLKFDVVERIFSSIDTVKNYIILHQLGRRNLDPKAASVLRGKLYNARKKEVPNPEGAGGKSGKIVKAQNGPQQKPDTTAEEIAKKSGVSKNTVKRDAQYAEAVQVLDIEQEVMSGKDKRPKQAVIAEAKAKQGNPVNPAKKPEPYKAVVAAFKRLEYDQMGKAIEQIDKIWKNQ